MTLDSVVDTEHRRTFRWKNFHPTKLIDIRAYQSLINGFEPQKRGTVCRFRWVSFRMVITHSESFQLWSICILLNFASFYFDSRFSKTRPERVHSFSKVPVKHPSFFLNFKSSYKLASCNSLLVAIFKI